MLEQKLGLKFLKFRFYYNSIRLEFDGYNEEHNIAFEYHGYQHYVYPNHWHKTEEIYLKALERDQLKKQYCKENNIRLIIIPYTEEKNLNLFIEKELSSIELAVKV